MFRFKQMLLESQRLKTGPLSAMGSDIALTLEGQDLASLLRSPLVGIGCKSLVLAGDLIE